jgi:hypothetical protein
MRVTKRIRDEYETLLKNVGESKFYHNVFVAGVLARKRFEYPENMILDQSEAFFSLFRSTGNSNYFTIGRLLRRAAHRLYRDGHRKNTEYQNNKRFLYIVR